MKLGQTIGAYTHVYNNTDENTQRACYIQNRTTDLFPSSIPSRNEFNCCILPGISSMDMRDALVNNLYGNRKRALVAVEFISSPRTLVSRWVSRSLGHVVVVWHRQPFYGRARFLSAACFSKPFTDYFRSSDIKIWIEYLCSCKTVSPTPLLVLFWNWMQICLIN